VSHQPIASGPIRRSPSQEEAGKVNPVTNEPVQSAPIRRSPSTESSGKVDPITNQPVNTVAKTLSPRQAKQADGAKTNAGSVKQNQSTGYNIINNA